MKSVFRPLSVGAVGELYDSNMLLRDEERAERAVKMLHQGGQHVAEPFRAVVWLGTAFRMCCQGAGFEEPLELGRKVGVRGLRPW